MDILFFIPCECVCSASVEHSSAYPAKASPQAAAHAGLYMVIPYPINPEPFHLPFWALTGEAKNVAKAIRKAGWRRQAMLDTETCGGRRSRMDVGVVSFMCTKVDAPSFG
jgi:hypothetical protein